LEIEALIELAEAASVGASSQTPLSLVDLRIEEVRAARSRLSGVAVALRSGEPPVARGVALANLLVRHGRSPLYVKSVLRHTAHSRASLPVFGSQAPPDDWFEARRWFR
jgi:hypothetical protein